jgi:hypothetical protein
MALVPDTAIVNFQLVLPVTLMCINGLGGYENKKTILLSNTVFIIIISNAFTNSALHITPSFTSDITFLLQFLIWSVCIENYTKKLKLEYIQNCDNKPDF